VDRLFGGSIILKIRPKKVATRIIAVVAIAFSPLILIPAHAQVVGATLSGAVTDQSGAVIPTTQISIQNIATGFTRTVTTDLAGFYIAPNLLPGIYEITAAASGFSTEVQTGITLTVGVQQVLNLTLQVGTVTQKIQVAGEAPAVQLATSSLSAVVNSTTVGELPLGGDSQGLNSSDSWEFPNLLTGPGCGSLINPGNPNNYIKTQCFAVPTAPPLGFYTANCDPSLGAAPQCFNLRGNSGRNILAGPGTSNLDFSVFENN
jgi:hypothetical protein